MKFRFILQHYFYLSNTLDEIPLYDLVEHADISQHAPTINSIFNHRHYGHKRLLDH